MGAAAAPPRLPARPWSRCGTHQAMFRLGEPRQPRRGLQFEAQPRSIHAQRPAAGSRRRHAATGSKAAGIDLALNWHCATVPRHHMRSCFNCAWCVAARLTHACQGGPAPPVQPCPHTSIRDFLDLQCQRKSSAKCHGQQQAAAVTCVGCALAAAAAPPPQPAAGASRSRHTILPLAVLPDASNRACWSRSTSCRRVFHSRQCS